MTTTPPTASTSSSSTWSKVVTKRTLEQRNSDATRVANNKNLLDSWTRSRRSPP